MRIGLLFLLFMMIEPMAAAKAAPGVADQRPSLINACAPGPAHGETFPLRELNRYLNVSSNCTFTSQDQEAYDAFTPEGARSERGPAGLDELNFEKPRFRAGADFGDRNECFKKRAVLTCVDRYAAAARALENSVAYAAIKEPAVGAMSRRLANRLAMLIRARASRDILKGQSRPPTARERAEIERAVDAKLARAFGACDVDQAGCLSSACKGPDAVGCQARQSQRVRQALREGNLRESMFFLYLSNAALTENVSRSPGKGEDAVAVARENQSNVGDLNAYVRSRGEDWQLTGIPTAYEGQYLIQRTGYGADNNRMRDRRTLAGGKPGCESSTQLIRQNPVPSLEIIPLSPRETAALAERLAVDPKDLGEQTLPYHTGESCFELKTTIADERYAKYNGYLASARTSRIPMLTGISGTTDSILNLGRALGLKSRGDFELLRAAALGWLVSSRDHSVHEVMTAGQSFKELGPYRYKPDGYKSILPNQPGFARAVEAYQRKQGQPLPADVLNTCLVSREARNQE